ncbi:MAG: hypothetical protein L0H84_08725 [Pseudonocardia sp.]|nr:hypothetical protein [Pseudonocardia sp.]
MPGSDTRLVEECRERLHTVLPELPRTIAELRAALVRHRGRAIQVVVGDPGDLALPCGLWLQMADRDVVWVDRRTSPMHQVVIIGHEFGHMVCGHVPQPVDGRELHGPIPAFADQQLGLSAAHITAIMGRCGDLRSWLGRADCGSGDGRQELEAEITGRLIAEHLLTELGCGLSGVVGES